MLDFILNLTIPKHLPHPRSRGSAPFLRPFLPRLLHACPYTHPQRPPVLEPHPRRRPPLPFLRRNPPPTGPEPGRIEEKRRSNLVLPHTRTSRCPRSLVPTRGRGECVQAPWSLIILRRRLRFGVVKYGNVSWIGEALRAGCVPRDT
ncbi:hypothetical protein glysoja_037552 [Glycine soja]|uniref:Uncharacterized protein n=1 Tax=Glycine soja TaxID=3848 RepID=A0A0B2PVC1_GLYSO|nr:hypothetical protein glysoja_037552 [Glycine soja]